MPSAKGSGEDMAQAGQIPQLPVHFLTTDFPPSHGGLENYSAHLAANLEAICEVSVGLGITLPPLPLAKRAPQVNWHWHRGRSRLTAGLWSAWDCLTIPQPQGARLHMQWSTALVSAFQRRAGRLKRLFICVHGVEIMKVPAALKPLMRFVLSKADAVVAGSHFTASLLQGLQIATRHTIVNHYGVEIPKPLAEVSKPASDDTFRLLCVHRLVKRKGTALLFEALARHRGKNWHLTLAGDGPEAETLKRLCHQMGLENQIHFAGPVRESEKSVLYRQADLFVLPSLPPQNNDHVEGLGLALLEAQAHALPVLAAHTGGIPEAMRHNQTGWLFKAGSCDDLADQLGGLFQAHRENQAAFRLKLAGMGSAGLNFVSENFSWEQNFARWREILASG